MGYDEIEALRKKAIRTILIATFLVAPIFVGAGIAIFIFLSGNILTLGVVLISWGILISGSAFTIGTEDFRKAYRKYAVPDTLKKYYADVNLVETDGIISDELKETQMVRVGDWYESKNLLSLTYKEVSIKKADLAMAQIDRNGTPRTFFEGTWIVLDSNYEFKTNVMITSRKLNKLRLANNSTVNHPVEINSAFNSEFYVEAQDPAEARYTLNSTVADIILSINAQEGGKCLFCFSGGKLHVGINGKRKTAKAKLFTPINENTVRKEVAKELETVMHLVDLVNGNTF